MEQINIVNHLLILNYFRFCQNKPKIILYTNSLFDKNN